LPFSQSSSSSTTPSSSSSTTPSSSRPSSPVNPSPPQSAPFENPNSLPVRIYFYDHILKDSQISGFIRDNSVFEKEKSIIKNEFKAKNSSSSFQIQSQISNEREIELNKEIEGKYDRLLFLKALRNVENNQHADKISIENEISHLENELYPLELELVLNYKSQDINQNANAQESLFEINDREVLMDDLESIQYEYKRIIDEETKKKEEIKNEHGDIKSTEDIIQKHNNLVFLIQNEVRFLKNEIIDIKSWMQLRFNMENVLREATILKDKIGDTIDHPNSYSQLEIDDIKNQLNFLINRHHPKLNNELFSLLDIMKKKIILTDEINRQINSLNDDYIVYHNKFINEYNYLFYGKYYGTGLAFVNYFTYGLQILDYIIDLLGLKDDYTRFEADLKKTSTLNSKKEIESHKMKISTAYKTHVLYRLHGLPDIYKDLYGPLF